MMKEGNMFLTNNIVVSESILSQIVNTVFDISQEETLTRTVRREVGWINRKGIIDCLKILILWESNTDFDKPPLKVSHVLIC